MANLGIDFLILALRIAVVFLLYLFLYQVVRVITRELRSANVDTVPASQYGYLTVVNAGPTGLPAGKKFPLNQVNSIGRAMTNDIPLNDTFLSASTPSWSGTAIPGLLKTCNRPTAPGSMVRSLTSRWPCRTAT